MSAEVTIQFCVPVGYDPGDYARLHGNGGSGSIDWNTALTSERFELFVDGAGIYGWGLAPWGEHPWGYAYSMKARGWGQLPWGRHPWGYGTALIEAKVTVTTCGDYKFGFKLFDSLGNAHVGTPEEAEAIIHTAPPASTGLKKNSYNKTTDVLVLDVAA